MIDASIAAAWAYPDEESPLAEKTISGLEAVPGLVPLLWSFEVRNLLLMGLRRKRLDDKAFSERLSALERLPIVIDADADLAAALDIALSHHLTFYDALYLELAQRKACALATLDKAMAKAAKAVGIELFGE